MTLSGDTIATLIIALTTSGVLSTLIVSWFNRRRTEAAAHADEASASVGMSRDTREWVAFLVSQQVRSDRRIRILTQALIENGIQIPPDDPVEYPPSLNRLGPVLEEERNDRLATLEGEVSQLRGLLERNGIPAPPPPIRVVRKNP